MWKRLIAAVLTVLAIAVIALTLAELMRAPT